MENIITSEINAKEIGDIVKEFVIKEVDMRFFVSSIDGKQISYSEGCQRINYCTCDCNYCSWVIA